MITKTLTQLWNGCLYATDHDNDVQISNAMLTDWINEDIRELWSILTPICRDEFTKLSGTLTIAGGASTYDLSGITDFLGLRGVDRDTGGSVFRKLKPWRMPSRSRISEISYHVTQKILRIEPAALAPANYRVWYVPIPTEFVVGTPAATIDLPLGGDKYVIQGVAQRIRARQEEDPSPHIALQQQALVIAKRYMADHNQGDQEVVSDVAFDYDVGLWE